MYPETPSTSAANERVRWRRTQGGQKTRGKPPSLRFSGAVYLHNTTPRAVINIENNLTSGFRTQIGEPEIEIGSR